MAKAKKNETESTENQTDVAAETEPKAPKVDPRLTTIVYVTDKATRPGEVFNYLQQTIIDHGVIQQNGKPGMLWPLLHVHMLENFKPKKSNTFGAQYCTSYIRGGISEGWLTDNPDLAVDVVNIAVPKKAAFKKASGPTEAGISLLKALKTIVDESDYQAGDFTKTAADIAEASGKDTKVVGRAIKKLVTDGFLEVKTDEESKVDYYRFTETGWNAVSETGSVEETTDI